MWSFRVIPFLALFACLVFAGPKEGRAQPDRGDHPTFGMGVSVNAVPIVPDATNDFDLPIGLTAPITFYDLRLEPQLGFVRFRQSTNDESESTRLISFGVGTFYLLRKDDLLLEPGLRIGFTRVDRQADGSQSSESDFAVDMFLGPALGAEYYVADQFSVGAEARFLYVSIGQPQTAPPDRSASVLQTSGAAFLRFHF